MKKILIADDHVVFIEALKQVIERTADLTVADEAADGPEVLAKVRNNDYDLLVLDISLPGRSGLDIMTELKSVRPQLPVLILSMHAEKQYAMRAIKSGAAGYLTKGSSSQELVEAMQEITRGKSYFSASLARFLADNPGSSSGGALQERLSAREYQVLMMIVEGATPRMISAELMVGIKTVNSYRLRILEKMQLTCPAELNGSATRQQLTD